MAMICMFTLMIVVGICWNAKSLEVYQDNEEDDIVGTTKE
jgi:hypothetical protein